MMEETEDYRYVQHVSTLKLDLSTVHIDYSSNKHGDLSSGVRHAVNSPHVSTDKNSLFQSKRFGSNANVSAAVRHPAVEPTRSAVDTGSRKNESENLLLSQPQHSPNTAAAANTIDIHAGSVCGRDSVDGNVVSADEQRASGNIGVDDASNTSCRNGFQNTVGKTRRQADEVVPPNSSPARLEGSQRKGISSPSPSLESRKTARAGAPSWGNAKKASSFSAPVKYSVKARVARGPPWADSFLQRSTDGASTKLLNPQASSTNFSVQTAVNAGERQPGKLPAAGSSVALGAASHHTGKKEECREDAKAAQVDAEKDEFSINSSDDSEEDGGEEEQPESVEAASHEGDGPHASPNEKLSEKVDGAHGQEMATAYPLVVEMDLDDADEEDFLDIGELRYNMRTGNFSRAYVLRGMGSHRALPRQQRASVSIVGGDKSSEPSWIFPWEVRPDIDVFAAAAAAAAGSSARKQQLPTRRLSSAPALASCGGHSPSPEKACDVRLVGGIHQPQKHLMRYQERESEEAKQGDIIMKERQKESILDSLSKMTQANEWAQMMKLNCNYRAFKTREGKLACHVYRGKSYVKRLPMEVFMSYEYPRLRRRFMLCCPYLHVQPQAVVCGNVNDTELRTRREHELQNVLLSTIQLTHALREQLEFLQRASA